MSNKIVFNEKGVQKAGELLEQFKDAISEKIGEYSGNALPVNSVFFVDSINWKKGVIEITVKNSARLDWEQVIKINTEQLRLRANEFAKLIKNKNMLVGEGEAVDSKPKRKAKKEVASTPETKTEEATPKAKPVPKKKVPIKKAKV